MKVDVFGLDGKKVKSIELSEQFNEEYEPDLVKRAILAIYSHDRQPYGVKYQAGMAHSAKLSRRRRNYKGSYGKGISRVPRKTMSRQGMQFRWVGANAPGMVGGRRAHPPKAQRIWDLKINNKERKKAIRSALSGSLLNNRVMVIEDRFENLKKLNEVENIFKTIGLNFESVKRFRAGKGKSRGREVRYKKNALVIVSKKCDLVKAVANLPGFEIVNVKDLNAKVLTIGQETPRQCLFTEGAIEKLNKERLFLNKQ